MDSLCTPIVNAASVRRDCHIFGIITPNWISPSRYPMSFKVGISARRSFANIDFEVDILYLTPSLQKRQKGAYITKKTRDQMMIRPVPVREFSITHTVQQKMTIHPTFHQSAEMNMRIPLKGMRIS